MWNFLISFLLFLISTGIVHCQNCEEPPNVAVIVVASVFTTLAVVLIVFGIIFFLLWKKRRDLLKPESTPAKRKHLIESEAPSPDGVSNPAFNDSDVHGDISLAEEGVGGYVRCQEYTSPGKKKSPKSFVGHEPVQKPWSSLPASDIPPGLQRNGSVGSFDDNFFGVEPEVSSVWLQSQDFIGLGFNIAGSMRDGIFVSQVHNRGPAVESGQFKVGDRILSVTISFENMVYEDALTILSYASPYPVRVTLQKEKIVRKDRRVSETPSTLSHPLFRSQSLNTLKKLRKDSTFIPIPQRSFSEMRPETKKGQQQKSPESKIPRNDTFPTIQENGSKRDSRVLNEDEVFQVSKETVAMVENDPTKSYVPSAKVDVVNENGPSSPTEATAFAAQLFDKLNEQDKLDMLRLSYEDPNDDSNNSKVVMSSTETSFVDTPRSVESVESDSAAVEPRLAPSKPERRKKKSSSGSSVSSCDQPNSPRTSSISPSDIVIDEVMTSTNSKMSESKPNSVLVGEISEEVIQPEIRNRKIAVSSDRIQFTDVDTTINNSSSASPEIGSRTLVDYSLSDMDSTLRPSTPEHLPLVEEEMITPENAKRDSSEQVVPNLHSFQGTPLNYSKNSSLDSDGKNDTVIQATYSSSSLAGSDDEKNESKLQNTSEVDFNVTSSNPSLFSTPYPSRNTKEAVSGMSYDISMNELNDIESQMSKKSKDVKNKQKRGIAFEVRDDFTSGTARTVSVEQKSSTVVRTMSCFDKIGGIEQSEKINQMMRTGSFKDFKNDGNEEDSLDWSGKRLVRSGSFSDIPQDDSIKDWRDHIVLDDTDTVNSESSLQDDIISSNDSINEIDKGLKNSNFFKARENLANLSDNSNSASMQSLTESSSRSSSPPPPYSANGKDNGLGSSPDSIKIPNTLSSGVKIKTDSDNNIIPSVKMENKENIRVSVSLTGQDDDTEC